MISNKNHRTGGKFIKETENDKQLLITMKIILISIRQLYPCNVQHEFKKESKIHSNYIWWLSIEIKWQPILLSVFFIDLVSFSWFQFSLEFSFFHSFRKTVLLLHIWNLLVSLVWVALKIQPQETPSWHVIIDSKICFWFKSFESALKTKIVKRV